MTDQDRQQINRYITMIAQGDCDIALDGLARLVSGRMLSVACAIVKNRSVAEDVVQDSFVRILDNAPKFKAGTNGYAWICKIVQNTALNTLRREKRFKMANIDDFFNISADVFVDVQSVNAVAVAEAMSVLNTLEKWLIYEKYFMDYTVRDSAASTGRSRSSVQRTIVQAEEKMRKFFNHSSPKNT